MARAAKWSSLKSTSIGRTKVRTWDRYLVYESEHLFCYIVGGVASPLLANVYLHEMDLYWQEQERLIQTNRERILDLVRGATG